MADWRARSPAESVSLARRHQVAPAAQTARSAAPIAAAISRPRRTATRCALAVARSRDPKARREEGWGTSHIRKRRRDETLLGLRKRKTPLVVPASEGAGGLEHRLGVAGHLHLRPDLRDPPSPVDEDGRALDPHVFAAVHALFGPDAVGLEHVLRLVRGEGEVEPVFGAELVVALEAVRGDADHLRAGVRERAAERVEVLRLERAAAGVVLGIEIQHDLASFESARPTVSPAVAERVKSGAGSPGWSGMLPSFRRIFIYLEAISGAWETLSRGFAAEG